MYPPATTRSVWVGSIPVSKMATSASTRASRPPVETVGLSASEDAAHAGRHFLAGQGVGPGDPLVGHDGDDLRVGRELDLLGGADGRRERLDGALVGAADLDAGVAGRGGLGRGVGAGRQEDDDALVGADGVGGCRRRGRIGRGRRRRIGGNGGRGWLRGLCRKRAGGGQQRREDGGEERVESTRPDQGSVLACVAGRPPARALAERMPTVRCPLPEVNGTMVPPAGRTLPSARSRPRDPRRPCGSQRRNATRRATITAQPEPAASSAAPTIAAPRPASSEMTPMSAG